MTLELPEIPINYVYILIILVSVYYIEKHPVFTYFAFVFGIVVVLLYIFKDIISPLLSFTKFLK